MKTIAAGFSIDRSHLAAIRIIQHQELGGVDGYRIKRNITYVRAVRTL